MRNHTKIRKLDRVLDEEDGDVISDEIPDSLLRVEFDRKASHVSHGIRAALAALHRRKANKNGGVSRRVR